MSVKNPQTSMERVTSRYLSKQEEISGEVLEKTSKNVKLHTRNLPAEDAHGRVMDYLRRSGFQARPGNTDRFGIGRNQREMIYKEGVGSPAHELGHALLTPPGETLREHQRKLGQVTTPKDGRGMTYPESIAEESAAYGMEPSIYRRSGVSPMGMNAFEDNARRDPKEGVFGDYRESQKRGTAELHAFEEGRKTIDPKGMVAPGASVDAKINARAARQQLPQTSMDRALARRKV